MPDVFRGDAQHKYSAKRKSERKCPCSERKNPDGVFYVVEYSI